MNLFPRDPSGRTHSEFLHVLIWGYEVKTVGVILGSLVVHPKFGMGQPNGMGDPGFWFITDNGGELNVERVNHADTLRSVPCTYFSMALDGSTMAYRVAMVLRGDEIDYEYRCPELCSEIPHPLVPTQEGQ
jgi:hypothetical protein